MNVKLLFHFISYLQYPFMLLAVYVVLTGNPDLIFETINKVLILFGLGISFSTLQDTTKTQNKMSRKIWEHPIKGKLALLVMSLMTLAMLVTGILEYFSTEDSKFKEMSMGLIVLGIGYIGLLKTAIEMFENHRLDKSPRQNKV